MGSFVIRRKSYSQYDETDNIKRMKDSDILAQDPKKNETGKDIGRGALTGASAGLVGGGILGGIKGASRVSSGQGRKLEGLSKGLVGGAKKGAILLGLGGAGLAYLNGRNKRKENAFYNDRLVDAKYQAERRENKDWNTNITQRD